MPTSVHDPIVALCVGHQPRVLDSVQIPLAVGRRVVQATVEQVHEHSHHFILAEAVPTGHDRTTIRGGIPLPGCEATVALPRDAGGVRVHLVQV